MSQKIGIVSPTLPKNCDITAGIEPNARIFWFHEMEAAYAYMLNARLDSLYIDKISMHHQDICSVKYKNLIELIHRDLNIAVVDIKYHDKSFNHVVEYFPLLATIFTHGQLATRFQPIVEPKNKSKTIYGFECLSRINYKSFSYAPDFIFNYAQEKLTLVTYDKICLAQAMSQAPKNNVPIFLNIRPQTLVSPGFIGWLKTEIAKNNLEQELLVLEITEQHCTISEEDFKVQCNKLKSMGVWLAIDDFGSGISNLSLLEMIEPNILKVSGRFINGAHLNPAKQKIVKNVIELACDFGISAIVENVEILEEWNMVSALGAKLAQGYYFYKPLAADGICAVF